MIKQALFGLGLCLLASVVYSEMAYKHGKYVTCYYSSWAFYR